MLPVQWPIAVPASDPWIEPALRAGRSRLATVRRDFLLDPAERLTEQERALMTAMLEGLVNQIADELRAAAGPAAANDDDDGPSLFAALRASGLLDIPDLVALLLERAEQIQLSDSIRSRGPVREPGLLQALLSDEDARVCAAAMALILARGRRLDRFGQCRVEFDDIPAPAVEPLVFAVAAALSPGQPHRAIAAAAAALVGRHDPGRSLDGAIAALVAALDPLGRLGDDWLHSAAEEGEFALLTEALARRAGVPAGQASHMLHGGGGQLMLLLSLADVDRDAAARLLATLWDVLGISDPADALARFDRLTAADRDGARSAFGLPQVYRDAVCALESSDGQRPF